MTASGRKEKITKGEYIMLNTDKIATAFEAICQEAERLKKENIPDRAKAGLATIISIAKHQNDIRGARKGSCSAHGKE